MFAVERQHGWKHGLAASEALQAAVAQIQRDHPDFTPRVDEALFRKQAAP
jgi:hypothetical protein